MDDPIDTGLTELLADPLTVTVTPVPLPADLTLGDLSALARDIARALHPLAHTLEVHHLSRDQYDYLLATNTFFKNLIEDLCVAWNAPMSTIQRLSLQSATLLEEALPSVGAKTMKADESLREQVEALKLFAKIAGADEPAKKETNTGERFSIVINLGAAGNADGIKTIEVNPTAGAPAQIRGDGEG